MDTAEQRNSLSNVAAVRLKAIGEHKLKDKKSQSWVQMVRPFTREQAMENQRQAE